MVPFALRSLFHDKIRLLIAVGGVAFAILLILVLRGIMDGTVAKATTYVDHVGADIFLAQEGVEHFALSTSVLPVQAETAAASVSGVLLARGIISVPMVLDVAGTDAAVRLVGFDTSSGFGGPWSLAKGTAAIGEKGLVMDSALARNRGIKIGDSIEIGSQQFEVQGLSRQTNALAGKVIFIRREAAASLIGLSGAYSYVLVKTDGKASDATVQQALRAALPRTTVLTRKELSNGERSLLGGLFVTPVNVMASIGLLVGIMVVGLTIYTAAAERLRDFGVLKAIGASNRYIYGVIIRQALIVGLTGFVLGLGAGLAAKPIIEYFVPDLGIQLRLQFLTLVLAIAIAISLVAALLPVYRISGVDPKQVFKA